MLTIALIATVIAFAISAYICFWLSGQVDEEWAQKPMLVSCMFMVLSAILLNGLLEGMFK